MYSHSVATPDGSSPLTRGKHCEGGREAGVGRLIPANAGKTAHSGIAPYPSRLIPAHAGKTSCSPTARSSPPAHPRSRGENSANAFIWSADAGSSPLTRGKPCAIGSGLACRGLIPAHAGKTSCPAAQTARIPAHPHSRGENMPWQRQVADVAGSSPLTRGKPSRPPVSSSRPRLIPTHAGKTGGQ